MAEIEKQVDTVVAVKITDILNGGVRVLPSSKRILKKMGLSAVVRSRIQGR